ncbi:ankyrin repeat-containing protein-like [Cucumis melo var. makuwa]|nr:ankyrin repeat-containing protein-like [Cucumis melo var. makuwa]TYK00739.1 ankyrin repeat-containing protein-like [Cucumis melo var. makuwa]
MVATTFIAAMAFQAGTNPPGGVWQDDNSPNYEAGKSIMATKSPSLFISFMSGVTVCFACSAMQFIVLLGKSSEKSWSVSKSFIYFTMGSGISAIVVAYWSAIKALTPEAQMSHVIVMLKTTLVLSVVVLPISMYIEKKRLASR